MKNVAILGAFTLTLMTVTFLAYREGYKDGKENRFDAGQMEK